MSDKSAIQWTDTTWNPTTGCTKVSPGCANCYIERTPPFRIAGRKFVKGHIPVMLHEERVEQPKHWRKPRRVFVNSLSDLFHEDIPTLFLQRVFRVMQACRQHQFQVLTKRPGRMREFLTKDVLVPFTFTWPDPLGGHIWLGVSVENRAAKWRIDELRETPAKVRFLSIEPLLEDVGELDLRGIHWVIVGGESGPKARRFNLAWARNIISQCRDAGVPCFVKQLGAVPVNAVLGPVNPVNLRTVGAIRDKKGGDMSEWPEDLRVREFPA